MLCSIRLCRRSGLRSRLEGCQTMCTIGTGRMFEITEQCYNREYLSWGCQNGEFVDVFHILQQFISNCLPILSLFWFSSLSTSFVFFPRHPPWTVPNSIPKRMSQRLKRPGHTFNMFMISFYDSSNHLTFSHRLLNDISTLNLSYNYWNCLTVKTHVKETTWRPLYTGYMANFSVFERLFAKISITSSIGSFMKLNAITGSLSFWKFSEGKSIYCFFVTLIWFFSLLSIGQYYQRILCACQGRA